MSLFDKIKNLIHDDASKSTAAQRVSAFSPEAIDSPPQYTFIEAPHAAKQGNLEKIQDYLKFNSRYAQCRSWDEKTLLHEAVSAGRIGGMSAWRGSFTRTATTCTGCAPNRGAFRRF